MDKTKSFKGSCHCGNIQYELITKQGIADFSIRRCDCSYCTKLGTRYISDPEGELIITIAQDSNTRSYLFGTKTAAFKICTTCGSLPFATCEIDETTHGIINVNTLDDVEHFSRHAKTMSYDGENLDDRLSRRKKNWIGKVTYR